jgi:hypothetical protein
MTTLFDSTNNGHVGSRAGFANGTWRIRIGIFIRELTHDQMHRTTCVQYQTSSNEQNTALNLEICHDDLDKNLLRLLHDSRLQARLSQTASMAAPDYHTRTTHLRTTHTIISKFSFWSWGLPSEREAALSKARRKGTRLSASVGR